MTVGVLTTCHTQYTWDRSIRILYLIEQHSKFLLHTLQVLYMWTLCDSTNINTIIRVRPKLFVACQRWWFQWRFWFVPSVPGYLREEEEHKPDPSRNPIERNHMGLHLENEVARRIASDHHWSHAWWWSYSTCLATPFSRCNPIWFLSMGLRQGSGLPVRYVTKTWSVVLLNKKIRILLPQIWRPYKRHTVHVYVKNRTDTNNNEGNADHFKIIKKVTEQHTGKTWNQGTKTQTY